MTRLAILPAIIAWLLPLPLLAQPAATETLSLEEVVAAAASRSASVRAAALQAEAATQQVAAARGTRFPRVSFSESWQRGDQPTFVFSSLLASRRFAADNFAIDRLNHPDSIGYARAAATVEQIVFDGGARGAGIQGAQARSDIAGFDAREAMLAASSRATELYGQLLTVDAERRAARAAVDAGREDLARAERRRDLGMATDADVLALVVHVSAMEQRAIKAEGDAVVLRAEVNRLTGSNLDRVFAIVEPTVTAVDIPPAATLFSEAESRRPGVLRAAAVERAAESDRRAARSALLPTVALQATVEASGTRIDDRASSWIAGGEVRWSLGAGGTERARATAARTQLARARVEAEDARAAARVAVLSAVEQLRSARAREAVGRGAVAQARERERIVRDRFGAGLAAVTDVLRAAESALDAENLRASALADEITSRASLDRALGRLPAGTDITTRP